MEFSAINNVTLYTPVLVPVNYPSYVPVVNAFGQTIMVPMNPIPPMLAPPMPFPQIPMMPAPSPVMSPNYVFDAVCGQDQDFARSPSRSPSLDASSDSGSSGVPEVPGYVSNTPDARTPALPVLSEEMTKRQIVAATLDWLSQVFGDQFDTIGNRGELVLRMKIKTREALDAFCPFVTLCVKESLLCKMSCPISTKNGRKHIRGYLAYMEAVSEEAAQRIIELYNEFNKTHLLPNGEPVFSGLQLNPSSVRPKRN